MKNTKTYSELSSIDSYEERFNYLKCNSGIGIDTFGYDRYLNQAFYSSKEWKDFRHRIIVRDNGCDMGHPEHPISRAITIHHLNPITKEDVVNRSPCLFDPENVVCVSDLTHKLIHYGNQNGVKEININNRSKDDTCPWKKGV